jgi:SET domain-containing protein
MHVSSIIPAGQTEVVVGRKRVLSTLTEIPAGAEITYDYNLEREGDDDDETERRFACACGARSCRGTMLAPAAPKRRRSRRA